PRAGRPQEPPTPADRVSEQPSLELGPVVGGERVPLCRGIDGALVATRPILAGRVQRRRHGAVGRPPRREEQALLAQHLLEHGASRRRPAARRKGVAREPAGAGVPPPPGSWALGGGRGWPPGR